MNFDENKVVVLLKKILCTFIGVFFMGIGIAINSMSLLGNDPISVFFDGISKKFIINLGMASSVVNVVLLIIILVIDYHYINIGTFLYTFFLGTFINMGESFYKFFVLPDNVVVKVILSLCGCFLLFLGIAVYISVEFGLDTWSGVTLILSKKLKIKYKFVKITLDILCFIFGWMLGGTVGITTAVAAIVGGPAIDKMSKVLNNTILSWIKLK